MLRPCPPMSNVERQRQFRKRHPGYFSKYKAVAQNARKAARAAWAAEAAAATASAASAEAASPLMLPAPAEIPVIHGLIAIAGIHTPAAPKAA